MLAVMIVEVPGIDCGFIRMFVGTSEILLCCGVVATVVEALVVATLHVMVLVMVLVAADEVVDAVLIGNMVGVNERAFSS